MNQQSKHTPGPWTIEPYDRSDKDIIISGRYPICFVDFDDVEHDEQEANARLIKAAPELYAAIKAALIYDENDDIISWARFIDLAHKAIAEVES